jgi:hypothetical protein
MIQEIPALEFEPTGGNHAEIKTVVIYGAEGKRPVLDQYGACRALRPKDFSLPLKQGVLKGTVGMNILYALQKGRDSPYSVDSLTQLASYFTHWHIWKTIVDKGWTTTLIVEQHHLPSDFSLDLLGPFDTISADVMVLGWSRGFGHTGGPLRLSVTAHSNWMRMGIAGGIPEDMAGYVLSLEGAKKLLEHALPMVLPLHVYIYSHGKTDDSFICLLHQPPFFRRNVSVPVPKELGTEISLQNMILYMMGAFLLLCIGIILAGMIYFFHSRNPSPLQPLTKGAA